MTEKVAAPVCNAEKKGRGNPPRWPQDTLLPTEIGTDFAEKWLLLGRYSSPVN
jgi:hypothetical protein